MNIHDLNLENIKQEDIITRECVHTYSNKLDDGRQFLSIKEQIILKDGSIVPNLRIIIDPTMNIYVTKKELRTYTRCRDQEHLSNLEMVVTTPNDMYRDLKRALNMRGNVKYKDLINSPYVYGADIDIESYYKLLYTTKNGNFYATPDVAYLDIETDLNNGEQKDTTIASITYLKHKCIDVFIDSSYMYNIDEYGNETPVTLDMIKESVEEEHGEDIRKYSLDVNYNLSYGQLELHEGIFKSLHTRKPDFVSVWNLDYEISRFIAKLEELNIDPKDMFSDPNLPDHMRYFNYKYDQGYIEKSTHITERWHWVDAPAHFQWIDNMCLYTWNRKTSQKLTSYSLDNVLKVNKCPGKTHKIEDHAEFSRTRFHDYVAYNIGDTLRFAIGDTEIIKDVEGLCVNGSCTTFRNYNKAGENSKTAYYDTMKKHDIILGSQIGNYPRLGDDRIVKKGGGVLSPAHAYYSGLYCIRDDDDCLTLVNVFVCDADFTSIYPSIMVACNISNDTHVFTPMSIEGEEPSTYFGKIVSLDENINNICSEYYNLPTYDELDDIFKTEYQGVKRV